jgi:hypothetical protein
MRVTSAVATVALTLLLAGCISSGGGGGGGSGDSAGDGPDWDEMVWNEDDWG